MLLKNPSKQKSFRPLVDMVWYGMIPICRPASGHCIDSTSKNMRLLSEKYVIYNNKKLKLPSYEVADVNPQ